MVFIYKIIYLIIKTLLFLSPDSAPAVFESRKEVFLISVLFSKEDFLLEIDEREWGDLVSPDDGCFSSKFFNEKENLEESVGFWVLV